MKHKRNSPCFHTTIWFTLFFTFHAFIFHFSLFRFSPLSPLHLHLVVAREAAFEDIVDLTLDHLLAQSNDMIGIDLSVEVVELVLHDACEIAVDPFVVLLTGFVLVRDAYARGPLDVLAHAWEREAAFAHGLLLGLVVLLDVGVEEDVAIALVLWEVVLEGVEVYYDDAHGAPHLRSCEPYAARAVEGIEHILYELLNLSILRVNILCHFSQNGLTKGVNW